MCPAAAERNPQVAPAPPARVGDETTQLDLGAELDRLSAMRGDGDEGLRLSVHGSTIRPETVAGHECRGVCDEGPADLRGREVGVALHALHREGVRAARGDDPVSIPGLLDAVGGPALPDGYVLDRETGAVLAVVDGGDPLSLVVADSSPAGEPGAGRRLASADLTTATVAGFADRARYRRYDAYGRP